MSQQGCHEYPNQAMLDFVSNSATKTYIVNYIIRSWVFIVVQDNVQGVDNWMKHSFEKISLREVVPSYLRRNHLSLIRQSSLLVPRGLKLKKGLRSSKVSNRSNLTMENKFISGLCVPDKILHGSYLCTGA